jgi:hypothetical protein
LSTGASALDGAKSMKKIIRIVYIPVAKME